MDHAAKSKKKRSYEKRESLERSKKPGIAKNKPAYQSAAKKQTRNAKKSLVKSSSRTNEQEIENLPSSDEATRADMAVALRRLENEIAERKQVEESLREKSDELDRYFTLGLDLLCIADTDGYFRRLNPEWERTLGYKLSELEGRKFLDFIHPDDIEATLAAITQLSRQKEVLNFRNRYRCKDGSYRWIEWRSRPMGELVYAAARDITEGKEAEEVLERYRLLAESSRDIILFIHHSNGRILEANQAAVETYGYTYDELLNMAASALRLPGEQSIMSEQMRQADDSGILFETTHVCKDGSLIPVEVSSRGATLNGERVLLSVIRDITVRKKAVEALRASEEKYRLVVENASDAILIVQDRMIKFLNRRLLTLTGHTEEKLTALPFTDFLHADDKEMVMNMHRKRLQGQPVPATYSFRIVNKAGEPIWVEISAVLITWEGRQATLNFLRDITIQKKLEEQLLHAQKMEAVGTLAGGVAHDFNNLLMGILGYTSLMLMKTDKDHPFYEKLKTIERQVESGAELTRQLLGFARGGKYEAKPINVNDLIIKTADIFGRTKKEIVIHRKLQEDLYTTEADAGQIEQVLFNLYVNAWQAMPSGGRLYIETENVILDEQQCRAYDAEPGPHVKITVTDTGIGMDSETQKRIFEPFFSTKGIGKGTGLGLASAYGIIRNHGGIINVYSEKGHGTTFSMYLPASEGKSLETKPSESSPLTGHETILIVDDEPLNTEAIKELLEELGYKIMTAQSGKKALELYREHPGEIQLVILDMIMPEMNGKETLVKLMETDKDVRVLLSSGYSINGEAKTILDLGCKGFIQKPFRVEELSRKIRAVLDSGDS